MPVVRTGSVPPVDSARFSRRLPTFWRSWPKPLVVAQEVTNAVPRRVSNIAAIFKFFISRGYFIPKQIACKAKL